MSPVHTPEPWIADKSSYLIGADDSEVGHMVSRVSRRPYSPETEKANAARIVACVNACAGIIPEAVPEMLEALREINNTINALMDDKRFADLVVGMDRSDTSAFAESRWTGLCDVLDRSAAAIAKATRGAQ